MDNNKLFAIFMTTLIISIPWVTVSAIASDDLVIVKATGADGYYTVNADHYTGYKRYDDTFEVEVHAERADGEDISETEVSISLGTGFYSADSCSGSGGISDCSKLFEYPVVYNGDQQAQVNLFSTTGELLASRVFSVVTDTAPPEISMTLSPSSMTTGPVTIEFEVTDSYAGSCSQNSAGTSCKCIGIENVEITESDGINEGTSIYSESPSSNPSCALSGSFSHDSAIDGSANYCVKATDRFGQENEVCRTIYVDNAPPSALTMQINKTYGDYGLVSYLSSSSSHKSRVLVTMVFEGTDISKDDIKANMEPLVGYKWLMTPESCRSRDGKKTCYWYVDAYAEASFTPSIEVNFSDIAGNEVSATLTGTAITADGTGPVINSIVTDHGILSDGSYLVASTNNITVTVTESVMDRGQISLDLTDVGGSGSISPTECTKSGSSYTCIWVDPSFTCDECQGVIRTSGTTDDLGNPAENELSINITGDTIGPYVKKIVIEGMHEGPTEYENRTVKGDFLQISAIVEDSGNPVTAYADLSDILTTTDEYEFSSRMGGCVADEYTSDYNCSMVSPNIDIDDYGLRELHFRFEDEIGNPTEVTAYVYLYGIENGSLYYSYSVSCSPRNIERQMAEKANLRSYCQIELTPKSGDQAVPIDIQLGNCEESDGTTSSNFVRTTEIFNTRYSYHPFIKAELEAEYIDTDYVELKCPINILSEVMGTGRIIKDLAETDKFTFLYDGEGTPNNVDIVTEETGNRYVTSTNSYEVINLTMGFGFYNNSMEDVAQQSKRKIEDILEDTWVKNKWMSQLEELITSFGKICKVVHLIVQVKGIWNSWTLLFSTTAAKTPYGPPVDKENTIINSGLGKTANKLFETGVKYCAYVTCDNSDWNSMGGGNRVGSGWFETLNDWLTLPILGCDDPGFSGSPFGTDSDPGAVQPPNNDQKPTINDGVLRDDGFSIGATLPLTGRVIEPETSSDFANGHSDGGFCISAWPDDVRDSCVLSIATLCIPGIIDCAQRYRNVECIYGYCLLETVEYRLSPSVCEDQHEYLECKFKMGEIFSVIPWVSFMKNIMQTFANALKNPVGIMTGLANYLACDVFMATGELHAPCESASYLVFTSMSIIKQVMQIAGGNYFDDENKVDACDEYFFPKAEEMGFDTGDNGE